MSIPIPIPTTSVAAKFAQIIEGLRQTVPKFLAQDRNAGLLIILIWSHLGRLGRRFAALAARAEAGTLPAPRRRSSVARRVAAARVPSGLPTGFAWLGNMMWETRRFGAELRQMVLDDAEMMALIAACPQVKRIVRSILWMTSQTPVPVILRVSRPKKAPASPRPSGEVSASSSEAGKTPPSVPPTRGGRKANSVAPAKVSPPYRPSAHWPRGVNARPRGKGRCATGPPSKG